MGVLMVFVAIFGSVLARSSNEYVTPVEVTLYYETLCPDCEEFIPKQLLPAYTDTDYDFKSLISKLTLVPFGWAYINRTTHEYQCQHGPAECEGNRLHGCAIKYINDDSTAVNYIACLENQPKSSKYPIDKCQNKLPAGLYQTIINCYNSNEGWEIFKENGKKTQSFFPDSGFVPYIAFNNKRDDDLAEKATENFRKTLCKVTGVADEACIS